MIKRLLNFLLLVVLAIAAICRGGGGKSPGPAARVAFGWKQWAFAFAILAGGGAFGGFLLAASGIIPIKASSGHWAVTQWFLEFSKKQSVATHSLRTKAPDALGHPLLVLKGAGHYEFGCRPCHGSPYQAQPRVAQAMTPTPPSLSGISSKFDPAELFQIVKHGIKFTGMPAWPSLHRDDEVWAMVAFLREYPNLSPQEYRRLALGDSESTERETIKGLIPAEELPHILFDSCARCHGVNGEGRGLGAFPKLAGQRPDYLFHSLQAYARGERHSGIMEPIAAVLNEEEMRKISLYYSQLSPLEETSGSQAEEERIQRGKSLALHGIPAKRIPACAACHGPSRTEHNPQFPSLAGQYPEYLLLQLQLFSKKLRGGTEYHHLMHFVASHLSEDQMKDVASFYGSLPAIKPTNPESE